MAILLSLLGLGKSVVLWLIEVIKWMFADFRRAIICGLIAAVIMLTINLSAEKQSRDAMQVRAEQAESDYALLNLYYDNLIADIARERDAAAAADAANVAAKNDRQKIQNQRINDDLKIRLADTRHALVQLQHRLQTQNTANDKSDGAIADMSGYYSARCIAFGYASCDGFFAALPGQLAAAEDNTARLIALQDWALSVMAIIGDQSDPALATSAPLPKNIPRQ